MLLRVGDDVSFQSCMNKLFLPFLHVIFDPTVPVLLFQFLFFGMFSPFSLVGCSGQCISFCSCERRFWLRGCVFLFTVCLLWLLVVLWVVLLLLLLLLPLLSPLLSFLLFLSSFAPALFAVALGLVALALVVPAAVVVVGRTPTSMSMAFLFSAAVDALSLSKPAHLVGVVYFEFGP